MARIIDKGSAAPDDPLFTGKPEFFSIGTFRPRAGGVAAGTAESTAELTASSAEQPTAAGIAFDSSSLPAGTEVFAKDDLPVFRKPGSSPVSAVTGVVLAKLDELEVVDRATFEKLVSNWSKRGHAS